MAMTRARRHLALIGDSSTIMCEPFIRELLDHCHEQGEVWSAQEYSNGIGAGKRAYCSINHLSTISYSLILLCSLDSIIVE